MSIRADVRQTMRTMWTRRGFTLAVALTLGIAVAAASTIARVADQALRRPLPYRDPERLLLLWEKSRDGANRLAAYPTFLDWQRPSRTIESLSYARGRLDILATPDGPARATTAFVSPGYFSSLGAAPMIGRGFNPDEERRGRGDAAVLSERFWRSQFGGDPAVIGRSVTLSGRAVTIVGVLSTPMTYPPWADLWRPISAIIDTDAALASRHHHTDSRVLARLRPGVAPAGAMAELATLQRRLATTYADHGAEWIATDFQPLRWEFVGNSAAALWTLTAGVGVMLLIACINAATLMLLRAFGRDREVAIRSALGALPRQLARMAAMETALLGGLTCVVAMTLTAVAVAVLRVLAPESLPRVSELSFDVRAVAFITAATILSMILAGTPALVRLLRGGSLESLRAGWQPTTGGRAAARSRHVLTAAQLALALTLVAGAGLLFESFRKLARVDLGFAADRLTAFWLAPPTTKYTEPVTAASLFSRLSEAAAAVPGVEALAISNHTPLIGRYVVTNLVVP